MYDARTAIPISAGRPSRLFVPNIARVAMILLLVLLYVVRGIFSLLGRISAVLVAACGDPNNDRTILVMSSKETAFADAADELSKASSTGVCCPILFSCATALLALLHSLTTLRNFPL